MKLTRKQLTKAVARYVRKYGFSTQTVRSMTALRYAAVREYLERR